MKRKTFLTPNEKISIQDKIIRFLFGVIVFAGLISLITFYLQSSLFFKVVGNYTHWGIILFLLPSISGLLQHIIDPPAKLFVTILGAVLNSIILYPLYANLFWASPPSFTVCIFFTFIIAGIGFTFSINPLDRHFYQRRSHKTRKKTKVKTPTHSRRSTRKKKFKMEEMLNSSMIRTFELILTIFGFVLAIWGTISMGVQQ